MDKLKAEDTLKLLHFKVFEEDLKGSGRHILYDNPLALLQAVETQHKVNSKRLLEQQAAARKVMNEISSSLKVLGAFYGKKARR